MNILRLLLALLLVVRDFLNILHVSISVYV